MKKMRSEAAKLTAIEGRAAQVAEKRYRETEAEAVERRAHEAMLLSVSRAVEVTSPCTRTMPIRHLCNTRGCCCGSAWCSG